MNARSAEVQNDGRCLSDAKENQYSEPDKRSKCEKAHTDLPPGFVAPVFRWGLEFQVGDEGLLNPLHICSVLSKQDIVIDDFAFGLLDFAIENRFFLSCFGFLTGKKLSTFLLWSSKAA